MGPFRALAFDDSIQRITPFGGFLRIDILDVVDVLGVGTGLGHTALLETGSELRLCGYYARVSSVDNWPRGSADGMLDARLQMLQCTIA